MTPFEAECTQKAVDVDISKRRCWAHGTMLGPRESCDACVEERRVLAKAAAGKPAVIPGAYGLGVDEAGDAPTRLGEHNRELLGELHKRNIAASKRAVISEMERSAAKHGLEASLQGGELVLKRAAPFDPRTFTCPAREALIAAGANPRVQEDLSSDEYVLLAGFDGCGAARSVDGYEVRHGKRPGRRFAFEWETVAQALEDVSGRQILPLQEAPAQAVSVDALRAEVAYFRDNAKALGDQRGNGLCWKLAADRLEALIRSSGEQTRAEPAPRVAVSGLSGFVGSADPPKRRHVVDASGTVCTCGDGVCHADMHRSERGTGFTVGDTVCIGGRGEVYNVHAVGSEMLLCRSRKTGELASLPIMGNIANMAVPKNCVEWTGDEATCVRDSALDTTRDQHGRPGVYLQVKQPLLPIAAVPSKEWCEPLTLSTETMEKALQSTRKGEPRR